MNMIDNEWMDRVVSVAKRDERQSISQNYSRVRVSRNGFGQPKIRAKIL